MRFYKRRFAKPFFVRAFAKRPYTNYLLLHHYTLAKCETKAVRNIFNYLNKNTFLKDLLRNGLQFL